MAILIETETSEDTMQAVISAEEYCDLALLAEAHGKSLEEMVLQALEEKLTS